MANTRNNYWRQSLDSETEGSDRERLKAGRPPALENLTNRTRSNTVSSSQTTTRTSKQKGQTTKRDKSMTPKAVNSPAKTKSEHETPLPSSPISPSALSPTATFTSTPSVTVAPTEDSDTDFQSAYSASPHESPRESYCDSDEPIIREASNGFNLEEPSSLVTHMRERVSSVVTEKGMNDRLYTTPSIHA